MGSFSQYGFFSRCQHVALVNAPPLIEGAGGIVTLGSPIIHSGSSAGQPQAGAGAGNKEIPGRSAGPCGGAIRERQRASLRWTNVVLAGFGWIHCLPLMAAGPTGHWSYEDRVLTRCDEAWFEEILSSRRFQDYLDEKIDPGCLEPVELGKFALVESFLPDSERSRRLYEIAMTHSNAYAAAALYACFEREHVVMGLGGTRFLEFAVNHDPGTAPELEAAFFAHIRDEPSFRVQWTTGEVSLIPFRKLRELNMFTAFADGLASRNQPYMVREWKRLSRFRKNSQICDYAAESLHTFGSSAQAEEFTDLVQDIRSLYRIAAAKRFRAVRGAITELPGPFENLRARIEGGSRPDEFRVALLNAKGDIEARHTMKKGEFFLLPAIDDRTHVLVCFDYTMDQYAFLSVMPGFALERQKKIWERTRQEKENRERSIRLEYEQECPDRERLGEPQHLAQFVGTYAYQCRCPTPHRRAMRQKMVIELKGPALIAELPWGENRRLHLVPCRGDEFTFSDSIEHRIRFVKNEDGTVTAFETRGNATWEWERKNK
jgi:hypothetical protein